jgi:lipoprotein-anchoring transpeptidase ErfK/SrfK
MRILLISTSASSLAPWLLRYDLFVIGGLLKIIIITLILYSRWLIMQIKSARAVGTSSLWAGVFFLLTVMCGPVAAQWRDYSGYQNAQPYYSPVPYPNYPEYPDYPRDVPRPRHAPPRSAYVEPGDPYSDPYGGRGEQQTYGEPTDLNVDQRQRTAILIQNPTNEPPGTIIVDTRSRHLYFIERDGSAIQYGIGVGRQGFEWKGMARVGRKAEWPAWYPPTDMLRRRPDLPEHMEGGIENPLGARALYLYKGNKDTLFRIHGTNEPNTIGQAVSSGCIRMMNADVIDLFRRVSVGTRVVVL